MRFGRNFQRSQVPAWRESYVGYSHLKALVNTKPTLENLKEALRHEISIIDSFLRVQDHEISAQVEALNEQWGTNIGRTKPPPQYRGVSALELEDLQTSLLECAHDVAKWHHYIKSNHEALSRILNKTTALFNAGELSDINLLLGHAKDNPRSHRPWLPALNTALKLVREAKENKESNAPSRSLLLEQYGMHHFPPETLHCLQEDDGARLEAALNRQYQTPSPEKYSAIARLVHVAFVQRSSNCQDVLLSSLQSSPQKPLQTFGSEDYMYLHQIIQQLARSEASSSSLPAARAFHRVLELLHPTQLLMFQSQDSLGRLPLHYAARLGLDGVCQEIIGVIRSSTSKAFQEQVSMCTDVFGRTPLDYAVRHGHLAVVRLLLSEHKSQTSSNGPNPVEKLGILATAISSGFIDIAMRLIQEGWGFQFVSRSGKNILHLASEHGSPVMIKYLVALGVDVNARENDRGWTPLITACVLGHTAVVRALFQVGADASIRDRQQWLGRDHAAYRGHTDIMNFIKTSGSLFLPSKHDNRLANTTILPQRSSTDSVVFIYLGTLDLLKTAPQVDITPYRAHVSPAQIPDTYLDLSISLIGGNSPEHIVSLPFMSDNSDRPWCFTTNDVENAAVIFKLISPLEEKPIGTAIALLKSLKGSLGANHESLIRDFTAPLVSDQHGYVGSVVFTFVIARPFQGARGPSIEPQKLELEAASTLGGHRGNGQNDKSACLQVGENTLQSFRTAIGHGVDVVEFDVQLTKDEVPVIYHDFLVVEKGSNAPMHTLTLKQFMAISDAQSPSKLFNSQPKRLPWDERDRPSVLPSSRRRSLCAPMDGATEALISQMERTLNYPGYKPNLRGYSIHEPFISLEELFHSLPEDIPFDIELKYPMLFEATDFEMEPFAFEVNHFLDTILSVIYAHAGSHRRIIFSSFSPEICMVLAVKQQPYPILFLNDSSNWPTSDMRATSLQTAARFAHQFGLAGVAMASEPFLASPGLVGFVRNQGLYTATYGPLNDDVKCVEIQATAGVDLIIVNKVKSGREALSRRKS